MQNSKTSNSCGRTYTDYFKVDNSIEYGYQGRIYEEVTTSENKFNFIYMPRQSGKTELLINLARHKRLCGKKVSIFCTNYRLKYYVESKLGGEDIYIQTHVIRSPDDILEFNGEVCLFDECYKEMIEYGYYNIIKNLGYQAFCASSSEPLEEDRNKFDGYYCVDWWEVPRYYCGKFDPKGWLINARQLGMIET